MASRRSLWVLLAIGICLPVAVTGSAWYGWTAPKLYRSAQSPDRGWKVTVTRARNPLYPLVDGVDVIVEVQDASGNRLLKDTIDSRDRWGEVEERYPEVVCRDDSILVGPGWFDGQRSGYYSIARVGLTHSRRLKP